MNKYYSPYKIVHHEDKLKQLEKGELPLPVFMQWDLTNKCNLNCNFCFYKIFPLSDFKKSDELPKDIVFNILDELKELGVKANEWTGGGSVEMHPYYKEILGYSKKLGFENALVTNGTLLDNESLEIIKDFSWVRFSIDASNKETYAKIKGCSGKLFDKAIGNLKKLVQIKNSKNIIGFSFIINPDNYKEIYEAGKMAKNIGCDNIRYSLAMTPKKEKPFEPIWEDIIKQLEKTKKLKNKDFEVFSFSNRIYNLSSEIRSEYCGYHHFVGVIAPSGVYPCCRLKDDIKFNFGDIKEKSFKEIWFGEKRKNFINLIENGCPFDCWMTDKNEFIQYLLEKNPEHKNFI